MCEKTGVLELLSAENKSPGHWVKDHIWPMDSTDMKWSTSMCVSFVVWKTEEISRLWELYTHPVNSPVKHCTIVCLVSPVSTQGQAYSLLAQNQSSFLGRGKCLWSPLSLTPWSIHPVMNEEAVKRGKAGGHFCVCVCVRAVVVEFFYPLTVSIPSRSKADHVLLSFTHSLYGRQNKSTHRDQLWSRNVLSSELRAVTEYGNTQRKRQGLDPLNCLLLHAGFCTT